MKRSISGITNVLWTKFRLFRLKLKLGKKLQYQKREHFAASAELQFDKGATITIGKGVYLRRGCSLKIRKNAKLSIGDGVMLNNACIIGCHDSITIGDHTAFGPGVYLYDHDHDYRKGLDSGEYLTTPIKIGKNCWIGAGTIILRGTEIGDDCVVGAGCVLRGRYPDHSLIVQKRETTVSAIQKQTD